ncbi:MAG: monofunctional biosynthetic peptidoglycan transglycosylase [Acidobacteriota bacterium]
MAPLHFLVSLALEPNRGSRAMPSGSPPTTGVAYADKGRATAPPEETVRGEPAGPSGCRRLFLRLLALILLCGLLLLAFAAFELATWPDVARLAHHNPATTAFIERYKARLRREGKPPVVAWRWVPYSAISPNLKRAVLVSENIDFFSDNGFDVREIEDSLKEAWQEKRLPRGASTITQQVAKNLWLNPSYNPLRKLKEAALTVQLDRELDKRRVLEIYLNVAQFGPGVFGAEAASEVYFHEPASVLTEWEAAQLAAGLPAPDAWHPGSSNRTYRWRVGLILRRMEKAQFLKNLVG